MKKIFVFSVLLLALGILGYAAEAPKVYLQEILQAAPKPTDKNKARVVLMENGAFKSFGLMSTATGPQGPAGPAGAQGAPGAAGPTGPQGIQGNPGLSLNWRGSWVGSPTGYVTNDAVERNGSSYRALNYSSGSDPELDVASAHWYLVALKGDQGIAGPAGIQGPAGVQGSQGIQGVSGPAGIQGSAGPTGATGATGSTGPTGAAGPKGDKGDQGDQGVAGIGWDAAKLLAFTNISGLAADALPRGEAASTYATVSGLSAHTGNTSNPHVVTKTQVGLSNVDNTSDLSKPVSTAVQNALDLKAASSHNQGAETITSGTLDGDRLPAPGAKKGGVTSAEMTAKQDAAAQAARDAAQDGVIDGKADTSSLGPAAYLPTGEGGVALWNDDRIVGALQAGAPATSIAVTPAGSIAATDVQGAIDELVSEKLDVTGNGSQLTGITAAQVGAREKLTADRTYYVATTGSDSNDGRTAGTPFKTLKYAVEYVARKLDFAQYNVTLQLADGTYNDTPGYRADVSIPSAISNAGWELQVANQGPNGNIIIQGNTAAPGNVTFVCSSGHHCLTASNGAKVTIQSMRLQALGRTGDLVNCQLNSFCEIRNMIWGTMGTGVDVAGNPGPPEGNGGHHIYVETYGSIETSGTHTIEAGAGGHIIAANNSTAYLGGTYTLSGTPDFSRAFAEATNNSAIFDAGITSSGAATGVRYMAINNSTLQGFTTTELPGDEAGTLATGGIFGSTESYLATSKIDDAKGNGDTGYIWSADKSFDQLAMKLDSTKVGTVTNAKYCVGDASNNIQCTADGGTGLTDSASLASALSNETGAGLSVFNTGPTLANATGVSSGVITITSTNNTYAFTTSGSITLEAGDHIIPTTSTTKALTVKTTATGTSFVTEYPVQALSGETFTIYKPALKMQDESGNTKLIVQGHTGYVGVGYTNPKYPIYAQSASVPYLAVEGVGLGSGIFASRNYGGSAQPTTNDLFGAIYFGGEGISPVLSGTAASITSSCDLTNPGSDTRPRSRMVFSTSGGTTNAERMRIDSAGNVGIGTTTPGEKLEVSGNIKVSGTINNPALVGTTSTTIDTLTNGYADISSAGATTLTISNVVVGRVFTVKVTSSGGGAISFATLTPTWEGPAPATISAGLSTRVVCLGTGVNTALCSVARENF